MQILYCVFTFTFILRLFSMSTLCYYHPLRILAVNGDNEQVLDKLTKLS